MGEVKRGPNPLEITNWGEEYVPPTMRFQPGDEEKFWMIDTGHCVSAFYPLELTTIVLGAMPVEATKDPISLLIYGATPENIERASKKIESPEEIQEFDGLPVAPGLSEGVARVIHDVSGLKDVQPGDILICPAISPMWNPVFGKVKGVVTDVGGSLCHAGIMSREYGIPCIVGCGYATKVLRTGDKIKVDGTLGLVSRIE